MELSEVISTDVNFQSYIQQLESRGYHEVGVGSFARVYGQPFSDTVIKIGFVAKWENDGYVAFLKAIDPTNAMFPRVVDVKRFTCTYSEFDFFSNKEITLTDTYYVVEMERLVPIDDLAEKAVEDVVARHGLKNIYDLGESGAWHPAPQLKTDRAKTAYAILSKLYTQYAEDLHSGNVMFRPEGGGYELVVTDPVANAIGS